MKVLSIKEQPDGSAILELEMSEEEKNMFIEIGVLTCLKAKIVEFEEELKNESNDLRSTISD